MNQTHPLQTWLFLPFWLLIVRALVVHPLQGKELKLKLTGRSLLSSQSISVNRLNQTSLSSDLSANKPAVFCDEEEYGRDLIAADCTDAITGIKRTTRRLRFGERSADPGTWDVGLPSREIGGKDPTVENP